MSATTTYVHGAVPAIAGLAAGILFLGLFSAWAANPPLYRIDSWTVDKVTIPEGASMPGGHFEPGVVDIKAGNAVRWTNNETFQTNLVIEPACTPSDTDGTTTASRVMTEKQLAPGESFECRFMGMGEYHVHTEPWPWMQGTIRVSPW